MNIIDATENDADRIPWNPFCMLPIVNHHRISGRGFSSPTRVVERYIKEVVLAPHPSLLELRGFYELD